MEKLNKPAILVVDMLNDFVYGALACERGKAIVPATAALLDAAREKGVPVLTHYATQLTRQDYDHYDYLIGMDTWNIRNIMRIIGNDPERPKTTVRITAEIKD